MIVKDQGVGSFTNIYNVVSHDNKNDAIIQIILSKLEKHFKHYNVFPLILYCLKAFPNIFNQKLVLNQKPSRTNFLYFLY